MQGAWVRSLVRELDPTCHAKSQMPQQRSRILCTATKTWCSQIKYFFKKSTSKDCGENYMKQCWESIKHDLWPSIREGNGTHSSALAWQISWTEEPGGLQPTGWQRVGHNEATSLSLFTFIDWRRKWQPTPVFLPGESHRWGSLVGCRLWGCTESDTTGAT